MQPEPHPEEGEGQGVESQQGGQSREQASNSQVTLISCTLGPTLREVRGRVERASLEDSLENKQDILSSVADPYILYTDPDPAL